MTANTNELSSAMHSSVTATPVRHIFVVNNNPDFLDMIQEMLNDEGYRVTIETYGMEIEAHILATQPDVLLVDVSPGSDLGFLLIASLRADPDAAAIPIIVASTQRAAAERAINDNQSSVVDYLPKPFDLSDLYAKIEQALRR